MSERNEAAQTIFSVVKTLNSLINKMPQGMYAEIEIHDHMDLGRAKPVPYLTIVIAETYKESSNSITGS